MCANKAENLFLTMNDISQFGIMFKIYMVKASNKNICHIKSGLGEKES